MLCLQFLPVCNHVTENGPLIVLIKNTDARSQSKYTEYTHSTHVSLFATPTISLEVKISLKIPKPCDDKIVKQHADKLGYKV